MEYPQGKEKEKMITFENPVVWGWPLWDYLWMAVMIGVFLILGTWIFTYCDGPPNKADNRKF